METAVLLEHLAQAERHVRQGAEHIRRQREIIAELEGHGHDSTAAKKLLTQFEEMQALHIADRDRLKSELAEK